MAIQYGPPSLPIRSGSASAGYSGAFQHPVAQPKRRAPVSQTLAQAANQRVNAQLNPQIAAQNAFNTQQNGVIQNFAQALLGKLQPIAGQVGAGYDSAIAQQGALSGQAANFLQQANPSGKVAELLQQAGAPQSQQDQIAGELGQTFGGGAGVLAFTGGAIPGGQLAADKAASVGEAAQLPGFAALKGQQDLASALWQQGQDRRTLEATRPALYQAAAQDIRQNNAARAKYAQTAQQNKITNQFKADTLNQNWQKFTIQEGDSQKAAAEKTRQFNAKLQSANAKQLVDTYVQLTKLGYTQDQINLAIQKETDAQAATNKRLTIAQQNADTSSQRANAPKVFGSSTAGYQALTSDGRVVRLTGPQKKAPRIFGSATGGYYAITPDGRVGQIVAGKPSAGSKPKTLSAKQLKDMTAEVSNVVAGMNTGGTDPKTGQKHPPLSREDALKFLQDQGYMATPQMSAIAARKLNEIYGRIAKVKSTGGLGVTAKVTP